LLCAPAQLNAPHDGHFLKAFQIFDRPVGELFSPFLEDEWTVRQLSSNDLSRTWRAK